MAIHHSDRRAHRLERKLWIEADRAADSVENLVPVLKLSLAAKGVALCAGCGEVRVLEPGQACRNCWQKLNPPDGAA